VKTIMTLTCASTPETAGLDAVALQRLSAAIQADIDQGQTAGASIIVARGGVIGCREVLGNISPGRAAASDDLYLLMSLSKSFTAALALQAIDHGRFTLDTRAADILPGFGAAGKQGITVRQLLSHTAGVFPALPPPPPLGFDDMGNLAKVVAAISAVPVAYVPGTQCCYAPTAGHAVLAQMLVVTDAAKRSFSRIAREDLFEPLGMVDTRFGLSLDEPRRVPTFYTERNTTPATTAAANMLNTFMPNGEVPAGNAYGTADDAFRFAEVMRRRGSNGSYRLMSPALFDYASQNHTGDLGNGAWQFYLLEHGLPDFPANFSLLGGYVRGHGHYMTGAGQTASPRAFYAVGGGSTMWMVDPARDLTFVFLCAGLLDGLDHLQRLQRLSDLALAACID
jgi:CubicO group peptidase (beta-lactamase class C family)